MSIQSEIERINNNVQTTLSTIADTGVEVGSGSDALPAAAAALANEKQDKITASGILKGNGSNVSAAVAGTDYSTPSTVSSQIANLLNRTNAVNAANTSYTTFMARGFAIASAAQAESLTIPNGGVVLVYEG